MQSTKPLKETCLNRNTWKRPWKGVTGSIPKAYLFKDILTEYCKKRHPEIKKISSTPFGVLKLIGFISGNTMLKDAVKMFQYFEKTKELGDPKETNKLLGKPEITLDKWLEKPVTNK